jgi:translation initiation factor 1A
MGKNKGKGGKGFKKRKKGKGLGVYDDDFPVSNKLEDLYYAKVEAVRGDSRFLVVCEDGRTRLARACGTMRLKSWISPSDYLLVSIREYQDDKCDIIYRYNQQSSSTLRKSGEPFFQQNWVGISEAREESDSKEQEGFDFDFDEI